MHPEEAKIMARPQSWDNQALLGLGRGRFFNHCFDPIEIRPARYPPPSHCPKMGEQTLPSRLYCRNGAGLGRGNLDQLLGAALRGPADIKMIADQVEERVLADKSFGAVEGVAIAQRFRLADKMEPAGMIACDTGVSRLIPWSDHQTNIFDVGLEDLFKQEAHD